MAEGQDWRQNQTSFPTGMVPPVADITAYAPYDPTQSYRGGDYTPSPPTPWVAPPKNDQEAQQQMYNTLVQQNTQTGARGGDYDNPNPPDPNQGVAAANAQFAAWQNSPYRDKFQAPGLADSMNRIDQPATPPDMNRLVYSPGGSPDELFDSVTGEIYRFEPGGQVYYAGNITNPNVTELTRGTAAVLAGLNRRGAMGPSTPVLLRGGHSWRNQTSAQVPGDAVIGQIDPNNPSMADVGTNLSHLTGTVWAQVDDRRKMAIGVGGVLAIPLGGVLGAAAPALVGATEGSLGAAAATAGGTALGSTAGMAAGQLAGQRGNLSQVDWGAVARAGLIGLGAGAAGVAAGAGTAALGAGSTVSGVAGQAASKLTSQGIGIAWPPPPQNITAYQPYPGMTPTGAQHVMTQLGY